MSASSGVNSRQGLESHMMGDGNAGLAAWSVCLPVLEKAAGGKEGGHGLSKQLFKAASANALAALFPGYFALVMATGLSRSRHTAMAGSGSPWDCSC